ncbi:MAG: hypothetical protein WC477_06520 [Patescibacteria group bacterium]
MKILIGITLIIAYFIFGHFHDQTTQALAASTPTATSSISKDLSIAYRQVNDGRLIDDNQTIVVTGTGATYHRMKNSDLVDHPTVITVASNISDLYLTKVPMGAMIAFATAGERYIVLKEHHDNGKVGFSAFRHE